MPGQIGAGEGPYCATGLLLRHDQGGDCRPDQATGVDSEDVAAAKSRPAQGLSRPMIDHEDIDGLAAEYVLGSLDPAERAQVNSRRGSDRELKEAIESWEKRLGTLSDGVPGIEPPANLFASIAGRLWGDESRVIRMTEAAPFDRSARRWRGLAVGASGLA